MVRVGIGYDLHTLVRGRRLVLGGVEIPHETGLLGHSDADVLTHAICDALLGAVAAGDLGQHFPDTDPQYAGICSLELLAHVGALLSARGAQIQNVDSVVLAQRPKLAPHVPAMRENLAKALGLDPTQVGVKATTNEGVDAIGTETAIAAHAVACVIIGNGATSG
ncbi:MAG: 2-C-methyl-D-erythritol 2,4-cyclodiphosphate synthase [Armatimonadetes bacterium CG_4_10_14_3_um_filter_66_18]|nr:2-C-methyl-D-erythritol 2,4-cyclodiphosphate synthase [Armatimonadota bacterium]OIO92261.1 MAG: 2-C-methyl-D-erythritol 2,4-cyclodiphosphate synthase [Armatimonadetes bacterium CG2_30_66_41]PIU93053.1 MAG: 2-C-methyl-D-erythritol 2,4-cyclodiphosphate synthase [Armatimonadetes bacterium CG06_land_8_20_14_3_00_66_21]PIX37920.1 MAG: 2-C-methyl-D-erythritol 2,4-cyclodiphosphate synthase [Armatimonadetes bacterium CG_4_8_14_3_um_filter_66_20]PIY49282.1 MAG: 2-C-methyl-D-erythritol 2,4-cyclodiphos